MNAELKEIRCIFCMSYVLHYLESGTVMSHDSRFVSYSFK